jgi:hypothetical protein
MSYPLKLLALASAAIFVMPEMGYADSINFDTLNGNAVMNGSSYLSPATAHTVNGVGATLTAPLNGNQTGSFTALLQGAGWYGSFPAGAPVLVDGSTPGVMTISFTSPIVALTLAAQANKSGSFTETLTAYNGATSLGFVSASGVDCGASSCGAAPFLTISGLGDITSVTIATTNDSLGFALYGGAGAAIPEPASAGILGTALYALGWARRRRRRDPRKT